MYTWCSREADIGEVIREGLDPFHDRVCAGLTGRSLGANVGVSGVLEGGYQNRPVDPLYERLGLPYSLNALPAC